MNIGTLRLSDIGATASQFLRWWIAELAGLLPRRLVAGASEDAVVLIVSDDLATATLSVESGRRARTLGQFPTAQPAAGMQVLRSGGVLGALRSRRMSLVVRVPSGMVSRQEVELPIAAQADLDEAVGYDLDRYTPFSRAQAVYAVRLLRTEPQRKRLIAEVVVAVRATLEAVLKTARSLGLEPHRVEAADSTGNPASGDFLRTSLLTLNRPRPTRDLVAWGLAAAAAALAMALVWLPLAEVHSRVARLETQFDAAKRTHASAVALQHQIDDLVQEDHFLLDRKRTAPSPLRLLLDTTRVTPDDAWLTEWGMSGQDVRLTGSAGSTSNLVDTLERSGLFSGTMYLSPVTRERDGRERFSLATHAVTRSAIAADVSSPRDAAPADGGRER
ncbi:MAG TPA: PilN domain-containing protein [Stellaceae bacterium]|nr:PilN domain-containing protein [Stellaceae bacterium]